MSLENDVRFETLLQQVNIQKSLGADSEEVEEYRIGEIVKCIETMSLEKASDEDIEKALDRSHLQQGRTIVHMQNGTVYWRTVYKKNQEATADQARYYTGQAEVEHNIAIGDPVTVRFQGSYTHTQYQTNTAKIVGFDNDFIKVQLTERFETHNNSNHVYNAGETFNIPRLGTSQWDGSAAVLPPPKEEVPVVTPRMGDRVISSVEEASVGDIVEVTKHGVIRHGTVMGISQSSPTAARQHSKKLKIKFEDGKSECIKPNASAVTIKVLGGEPPAPMSMSQQLDAIRGMGVYISGVPTPVHAPVVDGYETYTETIQLDRQGNQIQGKGHTEATVTKTRPRMRPPTPEEIANNPAVHLGVVEDTYGKFDFVKYVTEFKQIVTNAGVHNFDVRDISISFSGDNMQIIYNNNGIDMQRNFSKNSDGTMHVYHAKFILSPRWQNNDFMKRVFSSAYEQYRNIGIRTIRVGANCNVGGYAWAKAGFRVEKDNAEKWARNMQNTVGGNREIGPDKVTKVLQNYTVTQADADQAKAAVVQWYNTHPANSRFPLKYIASISEGKAGKAILLGHSWEGHLDFSDSEQRNDFEGYIHSVNNA